MEAHRGEFEWQCPHCLSFNLCEVPHYAFDLAAGPKVVWNEEVYDEVVRYYSWKRRFEQAIKALPDSERRALSQPHFQMLIKEAGGLSVIDAANVLRTSPIGILAAAWEREHELYRILAYDLDNSNTYAEYILDEENYNEWKSQKVKS